MRSSFLPFALPDTDQSEIQEIAEAINAGWVTTGPKVHKFEAEFAAYLGAKHAIALNSGTAALHLSLEAVGIQDGDEVILPTLTFAATAEVVRYFNAKPVLVDAHPGTLNMDADQVEAAITPRTKAIIPVHLGGLPVDMDAVHAIAQKHGLYVVEDAAHALPTKYKGRMIGADWRMEDGGRKTEDGGRRTEDGGRKTEDGNPKSEIRNPKSSVVCFSFYATKSLTTGEGGMITTDNDQWAERCRIMGLHGISKDAWKRYTAEGSWYYEIVAPGFKYNMTDVAAAMGLAQLRKVEKMWARRKEIAVRYTAAFGQLAELQTPVDAPPEDQHAWHLYILRLNLERLRIDRARFIEELKARKIGVSVHFIPLHLHPYYRQTYGYKPEDFPVAYREYLRMISLPIYSKMSDQDVADVIEAVGDVVEKHRL